MLKIFAVILGLLLILMVLWETFETIVLPRRVTRQFRLTRFFYRSTWRPWTWLAVLRSNKKKHDSLLSYYGPLSLLLLLALWAVTLVVGFGLLHYGLHDKLTGTLFPSDLGNAMYLRGTTLFTLGLGDLQPASATGRFITHFPAVKLPSHCSMHAPARRPPPMSCCAAKAVSMAWKRSLNCWKTGKSGQRI